MMKRWIAILGAVVLGLLRLREAGAQQSAQAAFEQALEQCKSAETPKQCRQTQQACEMAQRLLPKLERGMRRDVKEDSLLNDRAWCEEKIGNYTKAEMLCRRLLALRKRRYGNEHAEVASSLNSLALVLNSQGKLSESEILLREALVQQRKLLSPEHIQVGTSLNSLALVLSNQGKLDEAETTQREAVNLFRNQLGSQHSDFAQIINNLASILIKQGRYPEAESRLREALLIQNTWFGIKHPAIAQTLSNLASALASQGKLSEATIHFREALALWQKLLDRRHPTVAQGLSNLGFVLTLQGLDAEAEVLQRAALAIRTHRLGRTHPDVGQSLNNLGSTLVNLGKLNQGEHLILDAIDLWKARLGPEHTNVAGGLNNLGFALHRQGRYAEAEAMHINALKIWRTQIGTEHPNIASSLNNLAYLYHERGLLPQALPFLRQAASVREAQLRTTVSETRMQALLDMLRKEEDIIYGLLLAPDLLGAKDLALQVALLRKGRVATAGATANLVLQRSRSRPEIEQRFQEWQSVRQQHEALLYGGLGTLPLAAYRDLLRKTKLRAEDLEAQLASALPELRALQPPKMEEIVGKVAAKLPARSALVEVLWTKPYQGNASTDRKAWGTPHYVALILFPDRRIAAVDLGEAATVDTLGQELRTALASPGTDPVPAAKRLHEQVMGRLQSELGDVRDLYLSLDGTLNVIPFDALHDGSDYLLGRYRFHYLTSGRDLLREQSKRVASAPLLLANPEFGQVAAATKEKTQSLYSRLAKLTALPGTLREAQAIAPQLGIQPLLGASAREEAVRGSAAPRILHIATHGLFLQDVELAPSLPQNGEMRSFLSLQRERSKAVGVAEAERLPGALSAMNRSALVLADAARGASAQDAARDGLLTADEARSLDLDGTQLVVLSACETGRGGLSAGQGVYGLRRAFLVAGAETLVTSLWRVSDAATGELMRAYYQKLLDKKKPGDRLGAMVEAMQELRAKPGREHPYYWAPFLVIGSDGPLRAATR